MGWGDELMVTGQVRVMQAADPRKVRVQYERERWFDTYDHNPRIARPGETGDFQTLRPREHWLRPYMAGKTERQWTWKPYVAPRGELYLTDAEQAFGDRHNGRVIVEPHLKFGASPNKQWGWARWQRLANLMLAAGVRLSQLGPADARRLDGVEFIVSANLRLAAAVIRVAKAVVVPEGGLHHTAAVFQVPAVVIYGGFISPAVTGYPEQVSLFTGGPEHPLGCGMRQPCEHCAVAMADIEPSAVAHALLLQLDTVKA